MSYLIHGHCSLIILCSFTLREGNKTSEYQFLGLIALILNFAVGTGIVTKILEYA